MAVADMQRIDVVRRKHAPAATTEHTRLGMVERLAVRLTPQRRMAAANMVANMVADIASLSC
jgi:hypothetical protein